jgi:hypothetical protein
MLHRIDVVERLSPLRISVIVASGATHCSAWRMQVARESGRLREVRKRARPLQHRGSRAAVTAAQRARGQPNRVCRRRSVRATVDIFARFGKWQHFSESPLRLSGSTIFVRSRPLARRVDHRSTVNEVKMRLTYKRLSYVITALARALSLLQRTPCTGYPSR